MYAIWLELALTVALHYKNNVDPDPKVLDLLRQLYIVLDTIPGVKP